MTDRTLPERVRALSEAATPGPWRVITPGIVPHILGGDGTAIGYDGIQEKADAAFIVEAVNYVRSLASSQEPSLSRSADLMDAWEAAEEACARTSVGGVREWPRLQGPFPMVGRPMSYQADVFNVYGRRKDDERIGLGGDPAEALYDLVKTIALYEARLTDDPEPAG